MRKAPAHEGAEMNDQKRDLVRATQAAHAKSGEPNACAKCGALMAHFFGDYCEPCDRQIMQELAEAEGWSDQLPEVYAR